MSDDVLGTARTEFAALLGADVKAFPPAKLAPGGFVIPGDPWLERGDTIGTFRATLDGVLTFRAVNNETATDELNGAIADALVAVENSGSWRVQTVSAPYSVSQDGENVKYLAVQITATKSIHL